LNNLLLNLTYSYINMKSPVYATPKHHLYLSGHYRMKKLQPSLSIQYVNHLDTDPSANSNYQNYVLVNSKISYRVWEFAEVFISAKNLLNQQYQNNLYYPMPGVTAFGGIKMRF
jgi:iron complex outermembrane recepter protein